MYMVNLFTKSRASKGFTLIELLVVVAIIGLLASIVIVSLSGARSGARDAKAKSELRQIHTAFELCYQAPGSTGYFEIVPAAQGDGTAWGVIAPGIPITCGTPARTFMANVPTGPPGVGAYQWTDNPTDDNVMHFGNSLIDAQDFGLRVQLEDVNNCFILTSKGVNERAGTCP